MMLLVAFSIIFSLGYGLLRLFSRNVTPILKISLSITLGLAAVGSLTFIEKCLFGWHSSSILMSSYVIVIILLFLINHRIHPFQGQIFSSWIDILKKNWQEISVWSGAIFFLGLILFLQARLFPLGGWDAWSCWNLKAKFMTLSPENWRIIFDPELWRSNTHYPLLLPSLISFGWTLLGNTEPFWPMLIAILSAITVSSLLFGFLEYLALPRLFNLSLALLLFVSPFTSLLAISQYSDMLISLFILSIFILWHMSHHDKGTLILSGFLLGCLSFTKTEGLAASLVLTVLLIIFSPQYRRLSFFTALIIGFIPTITFALTMAPPNAAFINGLTSSAQPSDIKRLLVLCSYPFIEIISMKWQGLWIILFAGLIWQWRRAFHPANALIFLFILGYLGIVHAYYWVNTFFEIRWWLDTTLHRILFTLAPLCIFWLGTSLKK